MLIVATVTPLTNLSTYIFYIFRQFSNHALSISAFWDQLRKLRLVILFLELLGVWQVLQGIFISHNGGLTSLCLADMPRGKLLPLRGLWKCGASALNIRLQKESTYRHLISVKSEYQQLNSFVCSEGKCFSHACPIVAKMLLSRNRILMVKGEHIPSGSNNAETRDRKILWVF